MNQSTPTPRRRSRILVGPLTVAALLVASPAAFAAAPAGSTASEASLQTRAQELAGQIEAAGQNLDRMAEAVDAAELRTAQLDAQMATLQLTMSRTSGQVALARSALRQQALLAYVTGGAPIVSVEPGKAGSDPSLTVSYADIIAGGQQRAVAAYRAVLDAQRQQASALSTARAQAAVSLAALRADQAGAVGAMAARQQALAQVKGQLATLVAQVQENQQRAEQNAVKATLGQQKQLPPVTKAVDPPAPTTTTAPPRTDPASPPSSAHPTTSTTVGAPVTTAPPTTEPTTTTTTVPPPPPGNYPARGWATAVHYAYAQLGKPYQWGGAGPNSFDCSGLTMMAWAAAGVSFPHLAQDQYDMTRHIPLSDVLPGDLVFFGTPDNVYHVGIYIGGGDMIDAPETGQNVSISSIFWTDLLGAGRVID